MDQGKLTRRHFLRLAATGAVGAVAVACGTPPAPGTAPTSAPAAEPTAAPAAGAAEPTAAPAEAAAPEQPAAGAAPADVAREKSLILMFGGAAGEFTDVELGNPYATGFTHQLGNAAFMEPLFFFSAFADQSIPWLAESHQFNDDFTELTVKLRAGTEWSDGTPFTAKDVVFTIQMLQANAPTLRNSTEMKEIVKEVAAADDQTVTFVFNDPNPRFLFDYLSSKFDTGLYWVPEHVFKDVDDVPGFKFFDLAKGWPLGTGPYKITLWNKQQKFQDVRPDWWAAKTGFAALPRVERIIVLPFTDDNRASQLAITDQIDAALDLRPTTIKTVVEQNPKIVTHAGREAPFGYVDWWPNSVWFNTAEPPFNDPDIRWAVSYALNRQQAIDVAYEGSGQATELPFPAYPGLNKFAEATADLLKQYPTNAYDPGKVEQLMTGKGFTKDGEGFWVGSDGQRVPAAIHGFSIHADIGPILAEQLRKEGFEAEYTQPPDAFDRMNDGRAKLMLFGHGGSIADPYLTLSFFTSKFVQPVGTGTFPNLARWSDPEYDKILDEMRSIAPEDPRTQTLYLQAMEIWLKNLPNAPLIQWFHRIPMNTTYWANWPTKDNAYVNGAFWHLTFPLILHKLEPAAG
ncbi:MAG: hypothetical protein RLZZ387_1100 [Chloroflexota bacterium]